jgi:Ketopantoate hydroxymethyltransferase
VTAQNKVDEGSPSDQNIDMRTFGRDAYEEVRRGAPNTFITAALFAGRIITKDEILKGAIEVARKGAESVLTPRSPEIVERLANEGMQVQGQVGMVPSNATKFGGIRTVGKTVEEALGILKELKELENAGAFGAEVEGVAEDALIEISKHTELVLNSLGAGSGGDVIFLFFEEIVGETKNIKRPRHAKSGGDGNKILEKLNQERSKAIKAFKTDVQNSNYPNSEHTISMDEGELDKLIKELNKEGAQ